MSRPRLSDPRSSAPGPSSTLAPALFLGAVAVLGLALGLRLLRPGAQGAEGRNASLLILLNPGPSSGAASLSLTGFGPGCVGKTGQVDIDARVLSPGGMAQLDLSDPGVSGLPGDCLAGGSVSGTGAAFAALVLTEETLAEGGLSAYLGLTQPEAANELWLPRWSGASADDGADALVLQNTGTASADVGVELIAPTGGTLACDACRLTLAPREAVELPVGALGAQTGQAAGAARVVSRQPLLGLALGHAVPDRWAAGLGQGSQTPPRLPGLRSRTLLRSTGSSALLARGLGLGTSSLSLVASGGTLAGGTLSLLDEEGKVQPSVNLDRLPARASQLLNLEAAKVAAGRYAGNLRLTAEESGLLVTDWSSGRSRSAIGWRVEGTDLLLPYLWPTDAGHAAWISVAGAQEQSPTRVQVALYQPGSRKALAVASVDLPPGGSTTFDLSDESIFGKLDGTTPLWATVSGDLPVVASVQLLRQIGGRTLLAEYEAQRADALAKELWLPWLRIGAAPAQEATATDTAEPPATATPRVTDTASPSPEPGTPTPTEGPPPTASPAPTDPVLPPLPATAVPTSGPRPDPKTGWRRLLDSEQLGEAADLIRLARGADGTIWCLLSGPRGGRLAALTPRGGLRLYADRRAAVAADFAALVRAGSIAGFWEVDAAGRVWVGGGFFDGQSWFQALPDEAQVTGVLRAGDRSAMAADGRVWVPQEATTDCERPQGCGARGLRLVDAAGGQATGIDLSDPAGGGQGVQLLHLGAAGPATLRLAGRSAADQGGASVAVTTQGLYLLPDPYPIAFPLLGPPAKGALRNAGEATAAYRGSQGLNVITWIEEQRIAGISTRVYRNTWEPAGRRWSGSEDLTAAGSPLAGLVAVGQRVTAAAEAPDGTLWLGTDGGFLVGRRGTLWLIDRVPATAGAERRIRALSLAANGSTVLVATEEGLFAFDGQSFTGVRPIYLPRLAQSGR